MNPVGNKIWHLNYLPKSFREKVRLEIISQISVQTWYPASQVLNKEEMGEIQFKIENELEIIKIENELERKENETSSR